MTVPYIPRIERVQSPEDFAWAAGFFDGEGTTHVHQHKDRHGRPRRLSHVRMSVSQNHREPLERFVAVVGCGKIHGPQNHTSRSPSACRWQWVVTAERDVVQALGRLWPWLSEIKRTQAWSVLSPYYSARGRPVPVFESTLRSAGHLNYVLTRNFVRYLAEHGKSYQTINDILGAAEGAKLEFVRRVVNDYETAKIIQNGDCYEQS